VKISNHNVDSIDDLVDAIDAEQVPTGRLISAYCDLLLRLAEDSRLSFVPSSELAQLKAYVERAAKLLEEEKEQERAEIRAKLWNLADASKESNPALYGIIRCVIFAYGKTQEWDRAPDPPVFYFLHYLKKSVPDIEEEFLQHFKDALFR
jgi:hypothetical protein